MRESLLVLLRNIIVSRARIVMIIVFTFVAFPSVVFATEETNTATETCKAANYVTGEIILKLKPGVSLEDFVATRKLVIKKKSPSGTHLVLVPVEGLSDADANKLTLSNCVALNTDPDVVYAELNGKVSVSPTKPVAAPPDKADKALTNCAAQEFVPGDILLKLKKGNAGMNKFAKKHKLKIKKLSPSGFALVSIRIAGKCKEKARSATRSACVSLNRNPEVDYAELNAIVKATAK